MIHFRAVTKRFGERTVLDRVDLDVFAREILFVIGGSGAGKSVLVKHLVGLLAPDGGSIQAFGHELVGLDEAGFEPIRRRIAYVFQQGTLLDTLDVADNVALPLRKLHRLPHAAARAKAIELLGRVQMADFAARPPAELGDGLRKRVAVARALAIEPELILFDEPTTSLDPISARRMDALIRQLRDELGVTSMVVSHDLDSIFAIADRIAFLYQGRFLVVGTPDELRASNNPIVHQFITGVADGPIPL